MVNRAVEGNRQGILGRRRDIRASRQNGQVKSAITQANWEGTAFCGDAEYTRMRLARLAVEPGGLAAQNAVEFKKLCRLW